MKDTVDSANRLRVSVVIPTYNAGSFSRQALDSILMQTFTNFELIVIIMDQQT